MIQGLQGQELDNITAVVLFVELVLISYIANDSWSFRRINIFSPILAASLPETCSV